MIIFVGGLIGAGKSTIARKFAARLDCLYYDVDIVKKQVYAQDPDYDRNMRDAIPFSDEIRLQLFDTVIEDLRKLRAEHDVIVVDETLHKRDLRQYLYLAAKEIYGDFLVIWVRADEKVVAQRLMASKREGHILDDPMSMHESFRKQFEDFSRSVIICNNNGDADDAVDYLEALISTTCALGNRLQRDN